MEKPPYLVNSENAFEEVRKLRRLKLKEYSEGPIIPRISEEVAVYLVAYLRDLDNFRRKSLEISGGKVVG